MIFTALVSQSQVRVYAPLGTGANSAVVLVSVTTSSEFVEVRIQPAQRNSISCVLFVTNSDAVATMVSPFEYVFG